MEITLTPLLRLAGVAQLGMTAAGLAMIRVTRLGTHLDLLPPFLRQLFAVYTGYIGGSVLLLAGGTLWLAPDLAAGGRLSRFCCAGAALFWGARLIVQFVVFDVRPFLTNGWLRLGYHLVTVTLAYLTAVYLCATFQLLPP